MVLEEITKEVTDAESNAENQKNSLSGTTQQGISPEQRSTRQGNKSGRGTDDATTVSLASTLPCRRRSRSSLDVIRRGSIERTKRRRASRSPIEDRSDENATQRSVSLSKRDAVDSVPSDTIHSATRGLFSVLTTARENERAFPDGCASSASVIVMGDCSYAMETCMSVEDLRLRGIHDRYLAHDHRLGSLEALDHSYCGNLKAALLKFLDTVVGYILYVQTPAHLGVTSSSPLDRLLLAWVIPEYQERGLEKCILHWWLSHAVRSVKYFTVRSDTSDVQAWLQSEGYKQPKITREEDHEDYIAMI